MSARRQFAQRRAPAEVTVRFACPRCAGDHPVVECDAPIVQTLTTRELGRLRARVLAEIATTYLDGGDDEHLRELVKLLRAIDSKLGRRVEGPPATLARRVQLAVERSG